MKAEQKAKERYPYVTDDMPTRVAILQQRQAFIAGHRSRDQEVHDLETVIGKVQDLLEDFDKAGSCPGWVVEQLSAALNSPTE